MVKREDRPSVHIASLVDLSFVRREAPEIPTDVLEKKIALGEVIVSEQDGQPVGFLTFDFIGFASPYLSLIRVSSGHRRRGAGKAMLAFAERLLEERGLEVLYSSSQADEPEPQAWHRHMGFEECGTLKDFNRDGIGEVFFRKSLPRRSPRPPGGQGS